MQMFDKNSESKWLTFPSEETIKNGEEAKDWNKNNASDESWILNS